MELMLKIEGKNAQFPFNYRIFAIKPAAMNNEQENLNNTPDSENPENVSADIPAVETSSTPAENNNAEYSPADIPSEITVQMDEIEVEKVTSPEEIAAAKAEQERKQKEDDAKEIARLESLTPEELFQEMKALVEENKPGINNSSYFQHHKIVLSKIQTDTLQEPGSEVDTSDENTSVENEKQHPLLHEVNLLTNNFRSQFNDFISNKKKSNDDAIASRRAIIERLKNLYTNAGPNTNYFKEIRAIKADWIAAGQVNKADYKLLQEDYFFHLERFNAMLDMNKEYLVQTYSDNLETRKKLIEAAKQLENEENVQKAINELRFLHKKWKEEAGPVVEEHRESTWNEFAEISSKIHAKKESSSPYSEEEKQKHIQNREEILQKIKDESQKKYSNHSEWKKSSDAMNLLREEFVNSGKIRIPKETADSQWDRFREYTKDYTHEKNEFYKTQKNTYQVNIDSKNSFIEQVKNATQEITEETKESAINLVKKLQEEWRTIGQVPRSLSDTLWNDFRDACNNFFDEVRKSKGFSDDNWEDNLNKKKEIITQIQAVEINSGTEKLLKTLRAQWDAIGKVPRNAMDINKEFNDLFYAKAREAGITVSQKNTGGASGNNQDALRNARSAILDLESRIANTENNLLFFANASRENPLLKDTYAKLDADKEKLASLKADLKRLNSELI